MKVPECILNWIPPLLLSTLIFLVLFVDCHFSKIRFSSFQLLTSVHTSWKLNFVGYSKIFERLLVLLHIQFCIVHSYIFSYEVKLSMKILYSKLTKSFIRTKIMEFFSIQICISFQMRAFSRLRKFIQKTFHSQKWWQFFPLRQAS